jgi:hypothetical protein
VTAVDICFLLGGGRAVFAGVFADLVVQCGGKSWWVCGELRGKRGQLAVTFWVSKNMPHFRFFSQRVFIS